MRPITKESELKLNTGISAIYFYESNMLFHKKMVKLVGKIQEKYPIIHFYGVDLTYFRSYITRYDLDSLPTIIIFRDGKEVRRIVGVVLTKPCIKVFDDIVNLNNKKLEKNNE